MFSNEDFINAIQRSRTDWTPITWIPDVGLVRTRTTQTHLGCIKETYHIVNGKSSYEIIK